MSDKILLVTGGSKGIGAAVALLATQRGCDVCLTYRNSATAADELVQRIERLGRRAVAVSSDAANEADVSALYLLIDERLGRVSSLVNNSGVTGPISAIDDLNSSAFDHVMSANVRTCFLNTKEASRRMANGRGGAIVRRRRVVKTNCACFAK